VLDIDAFRRALTAEIEGEVRFDAVTRALYSTDASVYQIAPTGVILPKSREDLIRAVALCTKHHCPLTLRGGGTSQAGQAIGSGVIIDTSNEIAGDGDIPHPAIGHARRMQVAAPILQHKVMIEAVIGREKNSTQL